MAISRLKINLTDTITNERKLNHIKFSVKTREARKRLGRKKKKETRTQSMEQKIVTSTLDINPIISPIT